MIDAIVALINRADSGLEVVAITVTLCLVASVPFVMAAWVWRRWRRK